jgi:hypothetical protein
MMASTSFTVSQIVINVLWRHIPPVQLEPVLILLTLFSFTTLYVWKPKGIN